MSLSVHRLSEVLSKALMVFGAFWAFFLAFYILVDVVGRNLNMPIEGTNEIVTNSIVTIVFLQIGYCVHVRGMIRADFLLAVLGPVTTRTINIIGYLLGIGFFFAVLYGTWEPAVEAWNTGEFEGEGAVHVPTWPSRFAIILGCGLAAINYLLLLWIEIVDPPENG
jgi:TRAP-type C4-dicarboxylate transport system permease small subunit